MKQKFDKKTERRRVLTGRFATKPNSGPNGAFRIILKGFDFFVISSDGLGWDHVSVSNKRRTPTWDQMCQIKYLFFLETETVLQFHPPKKDHINTHDHCLHLWRSQTKEIDMPPQAMV